MAQKRTVDDYKKLLTKEESPDEGPFYSVYPPLTPSSPKEAEVASVQGSEDPISKDEADTIEMKRALERQILEAEQEEKIEKEKEELRQKEEEEKIEREKIEREKIEKEKEELRQKEEEEEQKEKEKEQKDEEDLITLDYLGPVREEDDDEFDELYQPLSPTPEVGPVIHEPRTYDDFLADRETPQRVNLIIGDDEWNDFVKDLEFERREEWIIETIYRLQTKDPTRRHLDIDAFGESEYEIKHTMLGLARESIILALGRLEEKDPILDDLQKQIGVHLLAMKDKAPKPPIQQEQTQVSEKKNPDPVKGKPQVRALDYIAEDYYYDDPEDLFVPYDDPDPIEPPLDPLDPLDRFEPLRPDEVEAMIDADELAKQIEETFDDVLELYWRFLIGIGNFVKTKSVGYYRPKDTLILFFDDPVIMEMTAFMTDLKKIHLGNYLMDTTKKLDVLFLGEEYEFIITRIYGVQPISNKLQNLDKKYVDIWNAAKRVTYNWDDILILYFAFIEKNINAEFISNMIDEKTYATADSVNAFIDSADEVLRKSMTSLAFFVVSFDVIAEKINDEAARIVDENELSVDDFDNYNAIFEKIQKETDNLNQSAVLLEEAFKEFFKGLFLDHVEDKTSVDEHTQERSADAYAFIVGEIDMNWRRDILGYKKMFAEQDEPQKTDSPSGPDYPGIKDAMAKVRKTRKAPRLQPSGIRKKPISPVTDEPAQKLPLSEPPEVITARDIIARSRLQRGVQGEVRPDNTSMQFSDDVKVPARQRLADFITSTITSVIGKPI